MSGEYQGYFIETLSKPYCSSAIILFFSSFTILHKHLFRTEGDCLLVSNSKPQSHTFLAIIYPQHVLHPVKLLLSSLQKHFHLSLPGRIWRFCTYILCVLCIFLHAAVSNTHFPLGMIKYILTALHLGLHLVMQRI